MMMKEDYGCALLNTVNDNVLPASFLDEGHVHIVVRHGELSFYDGRRTHNAYHSVNSISILTYWNVGKRIIEE